jgi:hypothetical protein
MPQDLVPVSDKEQRLAEALAALTPRELDAYKYFVRTKQTEVADATAEEMYAFFVKGSTCDEIRRLMVGFSLGQIVGARVMKGWDARLAAYRESLAVDIPQRAAQTQLESADLLAAMLSATNRQWLDKLKRYVATGDATLIADIPLPKNLKDLATLTELFLKATGQDKKRVEVTGTVRHEHAKAPLSAKEAASLLDELDEDDAVDAEFTEAPRG